MLRRKLERKWLQSGLEVHRQVYGQQCAKVVEIIKQAKSDFYKEALASADTKSMFRTAKSLLSSGDRPLPSRDSDRELAERFAGFFSQKVTKIREALDAILLDSLDTSTVTPECTLGRLSCISQDNLKKLIARSPPKSCVLDPIPTWLLKDPRILETVLPLLTGAINSSLESGTVPSCLKKAVVSPLLKKHDLDPDMMPHYRPVSNLSFVSKLLENVVAQHISQYMTVHGLYERLQSAYIFTSQGPTTTFTDLDN